MKRQVGQRVVADDDAEHRVDGRTRFIGRAQFQTLMRAGQQLALERFDRDEHRATALAMHESFRDGLEFVIEDGDAQDAGVGRIGIQRDVVLAFAAERVLRNEHAARERRDDPRSDIGRVDLDVERAGSAVLAGDAQDYAFRSDRGQRDLGRRERLVEDERIGRAGRRRQFEEPASLVRRRERGEGGSICVDDATARVGGALEFVGDLDVHTARNASDQVTAFGVERRMQRAGRDAERLHRSLDDAAVDDARQERRLAAHDVFGNVEGEDRLAVGVERRLAGPDLFAVQQDACKDIGVDGRASRRARHRQFGRAGITRGVRLAIELDVLDQLRRLEALHQQRQRVDDERIVAIAQFEDVLATGGILGDHPGRARDAGLERLRPRVDRRALRVDDAQLVPTRLRFERQAVEQHGAQVHELAGPIDRLVADQVHQRRFAVRCDVERAEHGLGFGVDRRGEDLEALVSTGRCELARHFEIDGTLGIERPGGSFVAGVVERAPGQFGRQRVAVGIPRLDVDATGGAVGQARGSAEDQVADLARGVVGSTSSQACAGPRKREAERDQQQRGGTSEMREPARGAQRMDSRLGRRSGRRREVDLGRGALTRCVEQALGLQDLGLQCADLGVAREQRLDGFRILGTTVSVLEQELFQALAICGTHVGVGIAHRVPPSSSRDGPPGA